MYDLNDQFYVEYDVSSHVYACVPFNLLLQQTCMMVKSANG